MKRIVMDWKSEVQPSPRRHEGGRRRHLSAFGLSLVTCLGLIGGLSPWARAADGDTLAPLPANGAIADQDGADANTGINNSGPVRMARFAYLTGDVTWRGGSEGDWSPATRNLPLRQGAQIWVADGGRAELQFDDGSQLRLDANTLITLQTLYSDADGEFTEITLNDGEVFLRLNNQYSLYQVNTPEASLKAAGPARLRVGAGAGAQFAVRSGKATIDGANGKVALQEGDYLDVVGNATPYEVGPLPQPDAWDDWNDARDRSIDTGAPTHLPPNIALVAGNLDSYGSWHDDPRYGWVWVPREADPDWRPYGAGQWTWVEPFGWTWVAAEPWGWAPYHYGTWVHEPYGWGWSPGPSAQYWSPAVVSFYQVGTRVAWCPLAPREVVYPSTLAVGFRSANWSLFFSIGSTAVYYPGANHAFVAQPWSSGYVNRITYVNHVTNVTNINVTVNHNTYVNNGFVPVNARFQGGTQVEVQNFASSRAAYRPVASNDLSVFTRGQVIGAPTAGRPVAGPQSVPVTPQSFTPTHTFRPQSTVPQEVVNRSVYRASLPASVPRAASAPLPGQRFISRSVPTGRPNAGAGNTGHSSALEEYLRERSAGRGGSSSGNAGNANGNSGNPSSNFGRTAPGNEGTGNRGNVNNGDRPQGATPRETSRSVPTQPNATRSNAGNYRPLHTRPSGGTTRDSGGHSNGSNGGGKSDRSSSDHGH